MKFLETRLLVNVVTTKTFFIYLVHYTTLNLVHFSHFQARQFSLTGGTTIKDITRRIFYELMTPEFAMGFSYHGRNEKRAFKNSAVANLVLQSVKLSKPQVTDFEVKDSIQSEGK